MKIAILTCNPNFIENLAQCISDAGHKIRAYHTPTDDLVDTGFSIGAASEWADCLWFEFGQFPLNYLDMVPYKKFVVVRLHGIDMYSDFFRSFPHANYDVLAVVSKGLMKKKETYLPLVPKNKIKLCQVGVDHNKFNLENRIQSDKLRLCMVGNIVPLKGIFEIVKALNRWDHKNWTFTIIGEDNKVGYGNERYKYSIEEFIKSNNLQDKVILVPKIEKALMPDFYRTQDVIVSNSFNESMQLTIIEGGMSGCLPLINNWEGADAIYPNEYIFQDYNQFLNKLTKFANANDKDKELLNQQTRKEFIELFSIEETHKQVKEILDIRYDLLGFWDRRAHNEIELTPQAQKYRNWHQQVIKSRIQQHQPKTFLDFGCGDGSLFNSYMNIEMELHGCDVSPAMLAKAKTVLPRIELAHVRLNETLPYEDKKFDMVVCSAVLMHSKPEDINFILSELDRVCNGRLIIFDLDYDNTKDMDMDCHCFSHNLLSMLEKYGEVFTISNFNQRMFMINFREVKNEDK